MRTSPTASQSPRRAVELDPRRIDASGAARGRVHEVGHAQEVRDEGGRRLLVHRARRPELLDPPAVHHRHPVGHRQRLLLVVRHVDERDPDLLLQRLQLDLQLATELGVERPERLVEQEHRRAEDERTGQGAALLLAARELNRPTLLEARQLDELEQLARPGSASPPS